MCYVFIYVYLNVYIISYISILAYSNRQIGAAIGRVFPCRPHGRSSISNFIYRALDPYVSTGIVMGAAPMTIPVDTYGSSAL